eukprot:gene4215-3662_t
MHSYANSEAMLSQEEFLTNYPPECERKFETPAFQKLRKSGQELLRGMLRFEPTERIRAGEAVKHNYFHEAA